jgi:hypothetical protein
MSHAHRGSAQRRASTACISPPTRRSAATGLRLAGRLTLWAAWFGLVHLAARELPAAPPAGTTSRQARDDAIRALPLNKLDSQQRAKVLNVVNDSSLFRRMPTQVIECDPAYYTFLIEHPEVVVNIWSVLGISDVVITRNGPDAFDANDGAGTLGAVKFFYRSHDTHLLYGEGSYEGALFPKAVRGKCLLLLKTGYLRETNGRFYITCRMDAFMQLENVGIEILAKTVQPIIGPVADHNFRETAIFLESLNRAAEINHPGVQELSKKLTRVTPETRDEFAALTEKVAVRAALAETENTPLVPRATARRPANAPSKR